MKEGFHWRQAAAGRESHSYALRVDSDSCHVVCSLFGVILIARPQSLFGPGSIDEIEYELDEVPQGVVVVTPEQRLAAVG